MEFIKILKELLGEPGAVPGSYSRVMKMYDCPQSWFWTYRSKPGVPKQPLAEDTLVGILAHSIAQVYTTQSGHHKYARQIPIVPVYNMVCHSSEYSAGVLDRVLDMAPNIQAVCEHFCSALRDKECKVNSEHRIHIDQHGKFVSPRSFRRQDLWNGIIDLSIETKAGNAILVDYKSHSSSMDSLAASELKQLQTYALMTLLSKPAVKTVKIYLAYFGDNKIKQVGTFTREDIPALEDTFSSFLEGYKKRIQAGVFTPTKNEKCRWCNFTTICPIK